VLAKRVEEAVQRGLVVAGRGPDQPAGVVVDHHRQVAVPLAVGDLVDPDAAQPLQAVDVRSGLLCDAREHPADGAPGHPQQFGDRHPGSVDRQPRRGVLERAGEACAVACQGTAATTTPWRRQVTRGASASRNACTTPKSSVRQRRRPWPWS